MMLPPRPDSSSSDERLHFSPPPPRPSWSNILCIGILGMIDRIRPCLKGCTDLTRPKWAWPWGTIKARLLAPRGAASVPHWTAPHVQHARAQRFGWIGGGRETLGLLSLLIAGGLCSVTALRENDQERVTVYTEHQLALQAQMTEALVLTFCINSTRGRGGHGASTLDVVFINI